MLYSLWFRASDGFGGLPLFLRLMGSLIAVAFIVVGATVIWLVTLIMREPESLARPAKLAGEAAKGHLPYSLAHDCPRGGAPSPGSTDVMENGDIKCHHCGSWFNVRGK